MERERKRTREKRHNQSEREKRKQWSTRGKKERSRKVFDGIETLIANIMGLMVIFDWDSDAFIHSLSSLLLRCRFTLNFPILAFSMLSVLGFYDFVSISHNITLI